MEIINFCYQIVLTIAFCLSLYYLWRFGAKKQHYLFLYLGLAFFVELILYLCSIFLPDLKLDFVYHYFTLLAVAYFTFVYRSDTKGFYRKIYLMVFFLFLGIAFSQIFSGSNNLSQVVAFSFAFVHIIFALTRFAFEILNASEESIHKKPLFWVSTAILFWSIFFLLRIAPRFVFSKTDAEFHTISKLIFGAANIVTYVLFMGSFFVINSKKSEKIR